MSPPTITDGSVIYFYGNYTLEDGTQIIPASPWTFMPPTNCLAFGVLRGIGLVYLYGSGEVVLSNGKSVKLP